MSSGKLINDFYGKTNLTWDENELEAFRKLVLENDDLKCRTDDIFLLSFLRAKKFDKSKALNLLKNYCEIRKTYEEIFTNLKPSSLSKCLDDKIVGYLPNTDQHGRIVGVLIIRNWDHNTVPPADVLRIMIMGNDLLVNDHLFQVNGLSVITDAKGITWSQIIHATPKMIHLALTVLYRSQPIRYKEFHIINSSKLLKFGMAIILPFLPYKVKKRIHIHEDISSLHEFIEVRCLPSDFGGELPEYDPTDFYEKLKSHESFFEENEKYWKE